ncbi:putative RalBP1-associated Eps domain-containing protein 1 [Hypsibius exemplaris]|uniref:RalBP1-associated Eps domain-containing protein 1 n=1 Tax=Hypsibius exemplaris TaxID=2072580 RepID=A0A1W0WFE0_HYPEX|nr:putative RalBP1-associated Eps domain-containing protein 1 [Hypsibius exemplaris]
MASSIPPPPPSNKSARLQQQQNSSLLQWDQGGPSSSGINPKEPHPPAVDETDLDASSNNESDGGREGRGNSASDSVSSESEEKEDSEVEGVDNVAETTSSRRSNRSSPSVLSATIHQWPGYEEESHGLLDNNENEEASASDNSEENDDPDDPWKISPEQRGWYLSLFLRLQPDVHAFIQGKDARVFFENSQLPLSDLGEIWNCSDVDRDGRLSLAEFCYAMHLSVARRHGLPLPLQLPSSLKNSTRHILKAAEGSTNELSASDYTHQPEWTKFSDSPRNRIGPVEFRSTVDAERKLSHPLPVKASPKSSSSSASLRSSTSSAAVRDGRSFSTGTVGTSNVTVVGPTNPSVIVIDSAMAPPPPPRSFHSRSASLDLQGQMIEKSANKGPHPPSSTGAPPQLPPRSSPLLSKRLDSATSESDNDSRMANNNNNSHPSASSEMPKKPPRVNKTANNRNVSFTSNADRHWTSASFLHSPLPAVLDVSDLSFPSVEEIQRMGRLEIWRMVQRLRTVTEGLSRQNVDLQQLLTEVVLKKRTAELHLAAENAHKS